MAALGGSAVAISRTQANARVADPEARLKTQWLSIADALVHRFQPGKDAPHTLETVIAEPANDSSEGTHKTIEMCTLKPSLTTQAA